MACSHASVTTTSTPTRTVTTGTSARRTTTLDELFLSPKHSASPGERARTNIVITLWRDFKNTALFCLLQVANLPVYIWTASALLYRLDYGDDSLHYCDQSVLAENQPSRSLIIIVSFYACVMDIACDLVHRAERPVVRFSVRSLVSTHSTCAIYVIYLM